MTNRAWILQRHFTGRVEEALTLIDRPPRAPGPGELSVRVLFVSVDPGQATWLRAEGSYMPPLPLGTAVPGSVLGQVIESADPAYRPGELISAMGQWAEQCILPARQVRRVTDQPGIDVLAHMSVLGATGWTAYVGMAEVARPQPGETVLVSAAAGAVGSVAGQIARISGSRVIGIAGSAAKCAWLREELGFHEALDHRSADWADRLEELCPNGVNVYFENVGGPIGQQVYPRMVVHGRIALCGLVAGYRDPPSNHGIDLRDMLMKRVRIEAFNVTDHFHRIKEMTARLSEWLLDGRLRYHLDIVPGLERCASALDSLLDPGGPHRGKLLVQVGEMSA